MEDVKWYMNLNYKETKEIIREKLENMSRTFIATGYYLRLIRDTEGYKEDGYKDIWEFAEDQYGIKRSTTSRWMAMNEKFSEGGNSPTLAEKFVRFGKSQLQEMLYLEDSQLEQVTPEMTVKEIREVRNLEAQETAVEEEPVSILGYSLRIYPEGSLLSTPGCGKQSCFSCHRDGCELRQEACYCVDAPCGNPFPCVTLNAVESLRTDIGNKCQFVNEDLAYHRPGDGQPVPCCKKCNNPCGYECRRSVETRQKKDKENLCDVAQEPLEEKQVPDQTDATDYPELLPEEPENNTGMDSNIDNVVTDVEYREITADETKRPITMLTHLVEASLEQFDIDSIFTRSGNTEEFHERVRDFLFNDIADFKFCDTDMRAEFLDDIEIIKISTGEKIDVGYTWNEFFEELECIGEIGEKYAAEQQEEICVSVEDWTGITPRTILEEEGEKLKQWKEAFKDEENKPKFIEKQEIIVAALANMVCELEEAEPAVQIQPELPQLKNNEERKKFLANYETWPIWFEVPESSEAYHRFDLPDESSIVICEYHMWLEWKEKYTDENPDSIGTREYLLKPGYRYLHDCLTNTTVLVEHLKNLQKRKKQ